MTKTEIKKFLLGKKEEMKKKCWDDYAQKINEVFDEYAAANFTEVEKAFAKFQEEGNKAIAKTEKKWKLGYAYNLQSVLNAESFSEIAVNCFYGGIESLYYKTRAEDLRKIEENYNSLIANVMACKNAKEAEEYVRSLGFELPVTENNGCTTLAAPINTAYLLKNLPNFKKMKNQRNREPVGSLFLFSYNKEEEIGKANVKEYKK